MIDKIRKIKISTWKLIVLIGLPLISLLMHLKAFPMELLGPHVWRQTQTMSNAVNFYETDFNILNPRRNFVSKNDSIYRLEFPIMQWLFAAAYKVFGNHIIIARLLTFLISLLTLLGFYTLLKYLFKSERLALIGAWALNFSPAFYYYAVSPMPDNFALCCTLGGLAIFIKSIPKNDFKSTFVAAFLLGLGTATKLPFLLFYAVPFAYYLQKIFKKQLVINDFLKGLIWIGLFLPAVAWYAWAIPTWDGRYNVRYFK